jgi:hypothetical protein
MKKLILFMLLIVLFISQPIIANAWNSWIEDKVVNNLMVIGSIYNKDRTAKLTLGRGNISVAGNIYTGESISAGGSMTTNPITIMNANTEQAIWVDTSGNVWSAQADGLYKSTDNGATFTKKDAIVSSGTLPRMVFQDSSGYLYWSPWAYGKIRRSTDGGDTWADVGSFTATGAGIWGICEDSLGYLYAGIYTSAGSPSQDVILRSTDNGATWASCYDGAEDHIHGVACDPYTDYIYATVDASGLGGTNRIIRSVDNGANWTTIFSPGDNYITISFLDGMRIFGGDDNYGSVWTTTDDSNLTLAYRSDTIIVSFSTVKVGDRVYIGQCTSGTAGQKSQIISTTDGVNYRVEWQGTDTTTWSGAGWMATYGNDIYVAVNNKTNDDSFIFSTDKENIISRITSDRGPAELLIAGDNVVVQDADLRLIGGDFITDGDIEAVDAVLNISAGTSAKIKDGTQFYVYDSDNDAYLNWMHNGTNAFFACSGDYYLAPSGNDIIVTDSDIVLTNQSYKVKFNNDDNIWVGRQPDAGARLNYYNSNMEIGYNAIDIITNNVLGLNLDTTSIYSPLPIRVGADADANAIDNSSNGSGSTTLYIGNETVDTTPVSDIRVKNNVHSTKYGLDDLLNLDVVDFNYTKDYADDISTIHTGLIAQDVEKIYPYAVETLENDKFDNFKMVDYKRLVPLLIQSIKDLNERLEEIKTIEAEKQELLNEKTTLIK